MDGGLGFTAVKIRFDKADRHKYAVLAISEEIHSAICGSGDSVSDERLQDICLWLWWRVTVGWEPSVNAQFERYDRLRRRKRRPPPLELKLGNQEKFDGM